MSVQSVDTHTLKYWLDNDEAILLDVREPAEHALEHIPEAHLLPLGQVSLQSLPSLQGKKVVIHCRSGQRSLMACHKLAAEEASLELYNLTGGILAWRDAGYPVAL